MNLFVLAAGVSLAALAVAPAHAQVTVFENARLIVGNGNVVENGTLVVQGERITQAGPAGSVNAPAGATRVNLSGKTVMPTINDTHVHLSTTRDGLLRDLQQRGYWGVSSALSLGTDNLELLDMRNKPIPGAARFFSAGKGISRTEGRPTYEINSVEEARKAVRDNAAHKVDIIKVWVDDRDGKFDKVLPTQYAAAIDEAHKLGLRVTAHIFNESDAKGLMKANLDAFAHGVRDRDMGEETVAMFKARPNIVLGPNLPDRGQKVDRTWMKAALSAQDYAKVEDENKDDAKKNAFYGIQSRNLRKMNQAGVKIVLGTDGNKAWGPHEELYDMVDSGLTPMQAIVAATRNGAEFLKMNDVGTLEAGKTADFIVLDANPVDDITNTRKISAVYLRGVAVDRSKYPN
jgi:imidazolonepropionase-like amidohydrolase